MHPKGPSAFLPAGTAIPSIWRPTNCKLVGSTSDRKDFATKRECQELGQARISSLLPMILQSSPAPLPLRSSMMMLAELLTRLQKETDMV